MVTGWERFFSDWTSISTPVLCRRQMLIGKRLLGRKKEAMGVFSASAMLTYRVGFFKRGHGIVLVDR